MVLFRTVVLQWARADSKGSAKIISWVRDRKNTFVVVVVEASLLDSLRRMALLRRCEANFAIVLLRRMTLMYHNEASFAATQ